VKKEDEIFSVKNVENVKPEHITSYIEKKKTNSE
jgi:hypothetical protein